MLHRQEKDTKHSQHATNSHHSPSHHSQHVKETHSEATLKLIEAINQNDVAKADKALKDGAMIHAKLAGGMTPILSACTNKQVCSQVINLLIKHQANINDKTADGYSVTDLLSRNGRHDVLQNLFAHSMKNQPAEMMD